MRTQTYPSDIADDQWALIEPHLPVSCGGRPRKTDLRDVIDGIFYILRTGCQWRYLPKDFPPKSTVWRYFNQWRNNGTLNSILHPRPAPQKSPQPGEALRSPNDRQRG
jgi:putative transposase